MKKSLLLMMFLFCSLAQAEMEIPSSCDIDLDGFAITHVCKFKDIKNGYFIMGFGAGSQMTINSPFVMGMFIVATEKNCKIKKEWTLDSRNRTNLYSRPLEIKLFDDQDEYILKLNSSSRCTFQGPNKEKLNITCNK